MDKRTNEEWLADLRAGGEQQAQALEDLRAIILRGLPYAIAGRLDPYSPESEALAEEVVQETLLRVLEHLDSFEGRSQFTTWAHKIAVREALGQLRRRRWRDVPLPEMEMSDNPDAAPREMADDGPDPAAMVERNDLMTRIKRIIMEELTEKQRQALMTVAMQGMPLEEAAARMGMNRNALYKLMHDARLRLKRRMESEGMSPHEVLASFTEMQG
ncbi:MAG: sigma-70 family RNA polymerase sigma factor [Anaerolineales bacterium]